MEKNFIKRIFWFSMLTFMVFNILTFGKETVCIASFSDDNPPPTVREMEEHLEEVLPGPGFLEKAANFLYTIYDYIRKAIVFSLEKTIFKENPKLADFYGDAASFLASLTAVYLLLLLIASAKKIIGVVLILGWSLFFVTMLIRG